MFPYNEFQKLSEVKFDLISEKQWFWYQGVGTDILFWNSQPPICIAIEVPVIAHFP